MPVFTDQLQRKIALSSPPKRIVSVVPSQTELLYDLGLEKEVIGITKFCIHPQEWFKNKTRVGGTKTLHLDKIRQLQPDLIIANKEENTREQIEALAQEFPVYISDINNLDDSLAMILQLGEITGRLPQAEKISECIQHGFRQLAPMPKPKKALYLIWKDPYMVAGTDTFIQDMLQRCGFENLATGRYPSLEESEIAKLKPEWILLSSEPYPFKEKHIQELQEIAPEAKILLVDGEYFSWYGSRLQGAPNYFQQIISEA